MQGGRTSGTSGVLGQPCLQTQFKERDGGGPGGAKPNKLHRLKFEGGEVSSVSGTVPAFAFFVLVLR